MSELVGALTSYPTAVFSGLLGLVAAYWVLVILGAVDLDGDGGHEGVLDALSAKGEVAGTALDATAAKGEATAAALGDHADGAVGIDEAGAAAGAFNLRRTPITVTVSFLALFGFIASYLTMRHLAPLAPASLPGWLVGTLVLLGSAAVAIPLTSLATKPLEGLFRTKEGRKRDELVGSLCRVRSGRADDRVGQAILRDDGAELVIDIRVDFTGGPAVPMARGEWAMILAYDEERQAYLVSPYGELVDETEPGAEGRARMVE
ncbi:MAG: hypothetical protein FJ096_12380 [Deltaproteobacteria bacterium]|nr:hypothetical protein [Deltaproteobacteria bacterium]